MHRITDSPTNCVAVQRWGPSIDASPHAPSPPFLHSTSVLCQHLCIAPGNQKAQYFESLLSSRYARQDQVFKDCPQELWERDEIIELMPDTKLQN